MRGLSKTEILRMKTGEPFKYWVEGQGSFNDKEIAQSWADVEGETVVPLYTSRQPSAVPVVQTLVGF